MYFDVVLGELLSVGEEDYVAGNNLTRLNQRDVADHDLFDVHDHLNTIPNDRDTALVLLLAGRLELTFLLPVIEKTDHDLLRAHIVTEGSKLGGVLTTMRIATVIATPST